jgi:hypothetical protein
MAYRPEGVSLPLVGFPRLLKWIDSAFSEAKVSLVTARRLAIRRRMRSGAMTCSRHNDQTIVSRDCDGSGGTWGGTDLSLCENLQKNILNGTVGGPRSDIEYSGDKDKGVRLDEYGGQGLV